MILMLVGVAAVGICLHPILMLKDQAVLVVAEVAVILVAALEIMGR